MATQRSELTDTLAGISLFADVGTAELNAIAHIVEERRYAAGERILRQGISGSAFYIILDGEAAIRVSGKDYGTLGRGEFFGEISALLGDEDRLRAIQPGLMDGTSYFPARTEMEQNLATFAREAGLQVRYGCRWTGTRREDDRFVLETTDGEYRCLVPVFAFGISQPWKPDI